MGDFSTGWLAQREAADTHARSVHLVHRLAGWLPQPKEQAGNPAAPLTVLDLGCGTGSNLRYLAPRLSTSLNIRQRWVCLDRDEELLAMPRPPAHSAVRGGRAASSSSSRSRQTQRCRMFKEVESRGAR